MESLSNNQQVFKLRMNNGSNNTAGEFTRRKNWSQSVLESVRDVMHVLTQDLRIVYCSPASSEFLGYKPGELVNHKFSEYVHVDDTDMFVREFRAAVTSFAIVQSTYRFLRKDGKYTTLETRGRFHKGSFFGNARKVPTETAHTMDSFLDLKTENERLKRKLDILKNQNNKRESSINSEETFYTNQTSTGIEEGDEMDSSDNYDDYDIPAKSSSVYTQGVGANLDIAESLSLFTGLRYDMGERSVGISLGLEGGELTNVNMDQIMSYPTIVSNADNLQQRAQTSDQPRHVKKKRTTTSSANEEARICADCGTRESVEWRRGTLGPKTLCNACGLRWSKEKKKREALSNTQESSVAQ